MKKLVMQWPSVTGKVKLGDNIMMLSALVDYGDGYKWTVGPYKPLEMNKQLSDIYRSQLPKKIKLDKKEVVGRPRMIYHAGHHFPILKPDAIGERPIEEPYVILHGKSANAERTMNVPEVEGIKNVCIDDMVLSMKELFALIGNAEAFYGTHSGPMWVAVSCGVPCHVWYKPSAKCIHAEHNWNLLKAQQDHYGLDLKIYNG